MKRCPTMIITLVNVLLQIKDTSVLGLYIFPLILSLSLSLKLKKEKFDSFFFLGFFFTTACLHCVAVIAVRTRLAVAATKTYVKSNHFCLILYAWWHDPFNLSSSFDNELMI